MDKHKKKRRRSCIVLLIVILTSAIIFIIPASRKKVLSKLDFFGRSEKELKIINSFNIDRQIKEVDIFDEKIMGWENKSLFFYDFNGSEVLKKNFKYKDLDIVFGEDIIYAMNKSSGRLELLDKDGNSIEKLKLKTPFYKLKEQGKNIYIYRKDGDTESIEVIDRKGKVLETHEERIPILTVSMGNNNEQYVVSTLDVDKSVNSLVDIYSIDGEKMETIRLKDELVVYSEFIEGKIIIATEKNIYLLENGTIKWKREIDNLKDLEVLNRKIYLLYNNRFEILNLGGKLKKEFILDANSDLENIDFIQDDILLFGKRNVIVIQKNNDFFKLKSDQDIADLKIYDEKLLIQKKGKVEIYNIREKGDR